MQFRREADGVYLHFDLDVLGPAVARVNRLSPPDGCRVEELVETIPLTRARFSIRAASFASIEPECDEDGKTLQASLQVLDALLR